MNTHVPSKPWGSNIGQLRKKLHNAVCHHWDILVLYMMRKAIHRQAHGKDNLGLLSKDASCCMYSLQLK